MTKETASRDGLKALANLIREEKEELLARWREEVRSLPTAQDLDVPALNDHVPDLLRELACELEAACEPEALPPPVTDNPVVHGKQRFELGFDAGEVVAEYGLLRSCIKTLGEGRGIALSGEPTRVVDKVIDGAIAVAVETYVRRLEGELKKKREEHLAFVAHDLKTPLSAVDMAARLIQGNLPEESKGGQNAMLFQTLHRNVVRLNSMVKAVVREETGPDADAELKLRRREVDLWPLVQWLVYDLRPLAEKGGTRLVNAVPEDLVAFADAPALSQVFQNLLSNAIGYAAGGRVTVEAGRYEGGVECVVRDTGEGIPEELLGRVFEKGVTDPRKKGTGLGLAIVKRVVEAHGGEVGVESREGQGAVFRFTIPDDGRAREAA